MEQYFIGVLGIQGAGKSYVSEELCKLFGDDCICISIDKIGHESLLDETVKNQLVDAFGDVILSDDKSHIVRKRLGAVVFKDEEKKKIMNKITYPKIKELIFEKIKTSKKKIIIFDWALLQDFPELNDICDVIILVEALFEIRKMRVVTRDGITEAYFNNREASAPKIDKSKVNWIIVNEDEDGTLEKIKQVYHFVMMHKTSFFKVGVYPGSFDLLTNGHCNIIYRSIKIYKFDRVIVLVAQNDDKNDGMFTLEERVEIIKEVYKYNPKVEVVILPKGERTANFMVKYGYGIVIRGMRDENDAKYEMMVSNTFDEESNHLVNTIVIPASKEFSDFSSTKVRELVKSNGDYSEYVPEAVKESIEKKFK